MHDQWRDLSPDNRLRHIGTGKATTRTMLARTWVLVASSALTTMAAMRTAAAEPRAPATHSTSIGRKAPAARLSRARVGGIVVFLATYGISLAIPIADGFRGGREWLAVPLVGPPVGLVREAAPAWGLTLDEIG